MEISVKGPSGDSATYKIKPTDTITQIKAMVEKESGIPASEQTITFVELTPVFVVKSDGKRVKLDVNPSSSISEVQGVIAAKSLIPNDRQGVVFTRQERKRVHFYSREEKDESKV